MRVSKRKRGRRRTDPQLSTPPTLIDNQTPLSLGQTTPSLVQHHFLSQQAASFPVQQRNLTTFIILLPWLFMQTPFSERKQAGACSLVSPPPAGGRLSPCFHTTTPIALGRMHILDRVETAFCGPQSLFFSILIEPWNLPVLVSTFHL